MGLAPILVAQIFDVVKSLKALGVTVLLVEQNAFGALSVADRGYVMETGRITMSGPAADLIADERIRAAYLGI
jgi:branched-chain amino acid transport system ATP-binding protein